MRPDGLHHTKMVSAMFLTAIQRRHGLYLSVIAPTLVEKAAAGEHVTVGEYKGDSLANSNKGDRTSKHNGVLRAAQNAIRARSVGSIILGDKEKPEVTPDAAPQRHVRDWTSASSAVTSPRCGTCITRSSAGTRSSSRRRWGGARGTMVAMWRRWATSTGLETRWTRR